MFLEIAPGLIKNVLIFKKSKPSRTFTQKLTNFRSWNLVRKQLREVKNQIFKMMLHFKIHKFQKLSECITFYECKSEKLKTFLRNLSYKDENEFKQSELQKSFQSKIFHVT